MYEELFAIDAIHGSNSEMFQGRDELITEATKNLKKNLQTCVIFGERGVGKTSFAWQLISTLENKNSRFKNVYDKLRLQNHSFVPVVVKDLRAPRDIDELLIQCIAPSAKSNTLFTSVNEVYTDTKFLSYIRSTYQVDLNNLEDLLLLSNSRGNDDIIRRLFDDVLTKCREYRETAKFVFFVDETDKMESKEGLGDLIKNTNVAKFVFIGIADTVSELIEDHESAGRKLVGGLIKLDPLRRKDIERIFATARSRANNKIYFSPTFRQLTIEHSGGFPWIVQHIGDQSVSGIDVSALYLEEATTRTISEAAFHEVLPLVRHEYASSSIQKTSWSQFESKKNHRKIANVLAKARSPLTVDEIHDEMKGKAFDTVDAAVNELVSIGIFQPLPDSRFRFVDPIIRSFTLEIISRIGH